MQNELFITSRILTSLIVLLLCFDIASVKAQSKTPGRLAEAEQQSKRASDLLEKIMAQTDHRIPKELLNKAEAVAVFTDVKKVGLLFEGLTFGHGAISRRFSDHWSAPSFFILRGLSIGPQIEAKSINIVMLFMNDTAADWLLEKRGVVFERAKAPVSGPVGEIRTEQKEVMPVANLFSYTFNDDRLLGRDLKNMLKNFGIKADNDLNKSVYGLSAYDLLSASNSSKIVQVTTEVNIFSQTVARFFARN